MHSTVELTQLEVWNLGENCLPLGCNSIQFAEQTVRDLVVILHPGAHC
jgi:hypothetical protein